MVNRAPRFLIELYRIRALHRFAYQVQELCWWTLFLVLMLVGYVSSAPAPFGGEWWLCFVAAGNCFVLLCVSSRVLGQVNALVRQLESSDEH